jgi:hypothetical protein
MPDTHSPPSSAWEYQSLHRYLQNRFAHTVVLTFAQIESLIGFPLPELARRRPEWWGTAAADAVQSAQSRSWVEARRSATANLQAQRVTFERLPGS